MSQEIRMSGSMSLNLNEVQYEIVSPNKDL